MAFKKGDQVALPYVHTGPDVLEIIVETVNGITGVVEEVKLMKEDGSIEVMEVTGIVVTSVNLFARILSFFVRLFRKK